MLRAVLWTLRQRRYATLTVLMVLVAVGCAAMGTFELHRYQDKLAENARLRTNAHAAVVPLTTSLVPLVGASGGADVRYRHVLAVGEYAGADQYIVDEAQDGTQGFSVLTPLRTASGVVLVVRGFVAASASDPARPSRVAAAPDGLVRVQGWLRDGQGESDRRAGDLIFTVNPAEQAARLGTPTYRAFLTLADGQPGGAGLAPSPGPDLSNPTGGAAEWQLLSYVVQWYVFALLAVLAPFLFSRAEIRDARRRFLGVDPDAVELGGAVEPGGAVELGGAASGRELVVRRAGELATAGGGVAAQRWEQASRLAERYGRSLGPDGPEGVSGAPMVPGVSRGPVRDSSAAPHRSDDSYHGSYNDYLWQLALADGDLPDLLPPRTTPSRPELGDAAPRPIRAEDDPA